ncbi:MAG: dephospho-CoA kinase [Deltaproteobacteria bacterium]|nr:dephospho-CoA kinase [Deltaproteobacteria bacterium]
MVIGLTGGIGTGKSLVATELRKLGAFVIDADIVARDVMRPGQGVYEAVIEEFGSDLLNKDKTLKRGALGKIVFGDREKLKRLNELCLPIIRLRIDAAIRILQEEYGESKLIVVNAPLLIEVSHHKEMEKVIVVTCEEETQIRRIIKRDALSREEVLKRVHSQMPLSEKIKHADIVIDNNGTKEETLEQVREAYVELANL